MIQSSDHVTSVRFACKPLSGNTQDESTRNFDPPARRRHERCATSTQAHDSSQIRTAVIGPTGLEEVAPNGAPSCFLNPTVWKAPGVGEHAVAVALQVLAVDGRIFTSRVAESAGLLIKVCSGREMWRGATARGGEVGLHTSSSPTLLHSSVAATFGVYVSAVLPLLTFHEVHNNEFIKSNYYKIQL